MVTQVHVTTRSRTATPEEMEALAAADAVAQEHVSVEDADDWLSDIDDALAENIEQAATFWATFQQRGGQ